MDDVIAGAQSLVSFARSALTLSTGLQQLVGSDAKAKAEVSKLHDVLVSTHQSALIAIREQIAMEQDKIRLERKLEAFERWDAEASNYALRRVGDGVVAYQLKAENAGEASHLLCANCFEQRRKCYIQRSAETKYSRAQNVHLHVHRCHGCSAEYFFGTAAQARSVSHVEYARGYDDDRF